MPSLLALFLDKQQMKKRTRLQSALDMYKERKKKLSFEQMYSKTFSENFKEVMQNKKLIYVHQKTLGLNSKRLDCALILAGYNYAKIQC